MGDEKIQIVATAQDRASAALKTLKANVTALGTKNMGPFGGMISGFAASAVAGAGLGFAMGTAISGLRNVGEFLGQAAFAAAEDEKSVRSLGQALKENIPTWDGTTTAIDAATEAGIKLGFADEDSRASLQRMVTATGDVTKSIYLYGIAQDVARARSIDLAAASGLVLKASAGNARALKAEGINLGKAATATELLGTLQQKYAGQAEVYSATTLGALSTTAAEFGELNEQVGGGFLPVLKDTSAFLNTSFIPGLKSTADTLGDLGDMFDDLFGGTTDMNVLQGFGDDIRNNTSDGGAAMDTYMDTLHTKFVEGGGEIREAARSFASDLDHDLADSLRGNTNVIQDAMADVAWAIENPLELQKQKAALIGAMTTLEYKRGLATNTDEINTVIDQKMDVIRAQWFLLTGQAYTAGSNAATQYRLGYKSVPAPKITGGFQPGFIHDNRASGGPVGAGQTYLVGERGPELLRMGRNSGSVTPNHQMGGHGHDIYLDGYLVGRLQDERAGRGMALAPSSNYSR